MFSETLGSASSASRQSMAANLDRATEQVTAICKTRSYAIERATLIVVILPTVASGSF